MAQVPAHIVTDDGERIGVVASVDTVRLNQPDKVLRDALTGEELSRSAQPQLEASRVHVRWEDGTESALTEHLDQWVVLGSTVIYPKVDDAANPPPGAFGELPEQQAAAAAVDVAVLAAAIRAAAPLAEARAAAERQVEVIDDGALTLAE